MSDRAVHERFDTGAIPPEDRFDYWRSRVAPLKLEPLEDTRRNFSVKAETLRVGDVGVIEMHRGPARCSWEPEISESQGRLRLGVLAPSPAATAHWHGRDLSLSRGTVAILGVGGGGWQAPRGLRGIEVDVPGTAGGLGDAELELISRPGVLLRAPAFRWFVGPALAAMSGHLGDLAAACDTDFAAVWTALVAMVIRSAAGRDLDSADLAPGRRAAALRYIGTHLADPALTPDSIAGALGVSRRTLYTSFAGYQDSVAGEIRWQRLQRAHDLLVDLPPHQSIADIAGQVGLFSPAHFSRLFRAEYGYSPRQVVQGRPPAG